MSDLDDLVTELDLGSATGHRRRAEPVTVQIVRGLTPADLPTLATPMAPAPAIQVSALRHSHHQLAQLLARGMSQEEASLITGYSPAYISKMKTTDRAFSELLDHYGTEREAVFVDVLERMKALGLSTLDELQARLAEEPEAWSRRELMEMAELMLVKPGARGAPGGGSGATPAVSVNVKFVTAASGQGAPASAAVDAAVVDLEFEDQAP